MMAGNSIDLEIEVSYDCEHSLANDSRRRVITRKRRS